MHLEPIIVALRERCPVFDGRVAGAAEYVAAQASTSMAMPHAFVIPLDDRPSESITENTNRQPLIDSFGVVVVVSNQADERGQGAVVSVETIRRDLWRALLGWSPAEEYHGIEYEGGSLQAMDRARLWWQFEFGAQTEIGPDDGWQQSFEDELDQVVVSVDVIDPIAMPAPGPDGRVEHALDISNLQQE